MNSNVSHLLTDLNLQEPENIHKGMKVDKLVQQRLYCMQSQGVTHIHVHVGLHKIYQKFIRIQKK